jgi:phage terminase small subunit
MQNDRKQKQPAGLNVEQTDDPIQFLLNVMNNPEADAALRVRAAGAAAKLKQSRAGLGGKKGERKQAAEVAATGKFAPAAPPKLVVNNS